MKSFSEDTDVDRIFSAEIEAPSSELSTRLERYDAKAREGDSRSDARERGSKTSFGSITQTSADEPITPELVLVDPELAGRAREQLSEPEPHRSGRTSGKATPSDEALPDYVQPAVATKRPLEHRHASPNLRLAIQILVVTMLGAAAGIGITYGYSLKPFFTKSRESSVAPTGGHTSRPNAPSVAPTGGHTSRPNASRNQKKASQRREPKPHPATRRRASPLSRSTKRASPQSGKAKQNTKPPAPASATSGRAFGWIPVRGAASYLVQFYHGRKEIFRASPSAPRLVLPAHWTFHGHEYSLGPGRYRWTVRPHYVRRSRRPYGQPIVRAELVIQRNSGG